MYYLFFFSSRRRHTRFSRDWSSDVCSSDLKVARHGRGDKFQRPENSERSSQREISVDSTSSTSPGVERVSASAAAARAAAARSEERRVGKERRRSEKKYQVTSEVASEERAE